MFEGRRCRDRDKTTLKEGRTTHPWDVRGEMIGAIIRLSWDNDEVVSRIRKSLRREFEHKP